MLTWASQMLIILLVKILPLVVFKYKVVGLVSIHIEIEKFYVINLSFYYFISKNISINTGGK